MLPLKAIADLYSVDLELTETLLEQNEEFTSTTMSDDGSSLSGICTRTLHPLRFELVPSFQVSKNIFSLCVTEGLPVSLNPDIPGLQFSGTPV